MGNIVRQCEEMSKRVVIFADGGKGMLLGFQLRLKVWYAIA